MTHFGKTLIDTLGPLNGIYCVEFFEKDNGEIVLLEVNPRRPGNQFNYIYMEAFGIDFESDSLLCQWDYNIRIDAEIKGAYAASL